MKEAKLYTDKIPKYSNEQTLFYGPNSPFKSSRKAIYTYSTHLSKKQKPMETYLYLLNIG